MDPGTILLVAQLLNHYATPGPPVSLGYDVLLSSYRVLNDTSITTNFSYFKSAHFLSQFPTRYKVTYTAPALHQFFEEQFLRN